MKISLVVLTLLFIHACVAEIPDQQREKASDADDAIIQPSGGQDSGTPENQRNCWELFKIIKEIEMKLADTRQELETKLRDSQRDLHVLRSQIEGNKVAFGASISVGGNVGPYNTEITLVYKKVYVNTGSFNRATGIFTAPVRGVYYFSFSGHNISTRLMALRLMKNGEQMVTVANHPAGNRHETATNGMSLQLEVGDQVYMRLRSNTWIYDNANDHSTFVGHLLFRM